MNPDDPANFRRAITDRTRLLFVETIGNPLLNVPDLAAIAAVAHEVEDLTSVPVDLVVTGDRPMEEHGTALTRALREALFNAARHGRPPVSAYVEIGPAGVEAFVRDRGAGFELAAVPEDRLGVRQSILGRMERHGGTARVRRREDGTEVELTLPALEGAHA